MNFIGVIDHSAYFNNPELSDYTVEFVFNNKTTVYKMHSFILKTRSTFFKPKSLEKTGKIKYPSDYTAQTDGVFNVFLMFEKLFREYIYGGKFSIEPSCDVQYMVEMYYMLIFFNVDALLEQYESFLETVMKPGNVCELFDRMRNNINYADNQKIVVRMLEKIQEYMFKWASIIPPYAFKIILRDFPKISNLVFYCEELKFHVLESCADESRPNVCDNLKLIDVRNVSAHFLRSKLCTDALYKQTKGPIKDMIDMLMENASVCEGHNQQFKLTKGLISYMKSENPHMYKMIQLYADGCECPGFMQSDRLKNIKKNVQIVMPIYFHPLGMVLNISAESSCIEFMGEDKKYTPINFYKYSNRTVDGCALYLFKSPVFRLPTFPDKNVDDPTLYYMSVRIKCATEFSLKFFEIYGFGKNM